VTLNPVLSQAFMLTHAHRQAFMAFAQQEQQQQQQSMQLTGGVKQQKQQQMLQSLQLAGGAQQQQLQSMHLAGGTQQQQQLTSQQAGGGSLQQQEQQQLPMQQPGGGGLQQQPGSGMQLWHFEQYAGEAVFIPGGCAHQVRNLKSCCKVRVGRHGWAWQSGTGAGMGWVRLRSLS
jgi:hypothetical protein